MRDIAISQKGDVIRLEFTVGYLFWKKRHTAYVREGRSASQIACATYDLSSYESEVLADAWNAMCLAESYNSKKEVDK